MNVCDGLAVGGFRADPLGDLTGLVSMHAAFVPSVEAMEANKVRMEGNHRARFGHWYPVAGVPRNPFESHNGVALWNVENVFAGAGHDDMCEVLLTTLRDHSPAEGQCRVALVGPSGCGKTFVMRYLARAADAAGSSTVVKAVIDMDFSGVVPYFSVIISDRVIVQRYDAAVCAHKCPR